METNNENHDKQFERILNTLRDLQESHQAMYSYIKEIHLHSDLCECKYDEQPKADLGSFMSSNEIETVDLEQVSKDENKPSHIHKLRQMPKGEWCGEFTAQVISMQEESTLPFDRKGERAYCKGWLQDHASNIQFIVWKTSKYNNYTGLPILVAGKTYSFSGGYTDKYDNQTSLIFNKATTIREVNHE